MSSHQYRDPHVKDKMVSLIFDMGIPIAWKDGRYIEMGLWSLLWESPKLLKQSLCCNRALNACSLLPGWNHSADGHDAWPGAVLLPTGSAAPGSALPDVAASNQQQHPADTTTTTADTAARSGTPSGGDVTVESSHNTFCQGVIPFWMDLLGHHDLTQIVLVSLIEW